MKYHENDPSEIFEEAVLSTAVAVLLGSAHMESDFASHGSQQEVVITTFQRRRFYCRRSLLQAYAQAIRDGDVVVQFVRRRPGGGNAEAA